MGDGSRRAFLIDYQHREDTPILQKCQEFSRESAAFVTAAARVRGFVTFLVGYGARSIASARVSSLQFTCDKIDDDTGEADDDDGVMFGVRRSTRNERITNTRRA